MSAEKLKKCKDANIFIRIKELQSSPLMTPNNPYKKLSKLLRSIFGIP